jgi:hypothetical protein
MGTPAAPSIPLLSPFIETWKNLTTEQFDAVYEPRSRCVWHFRCIQRLLIDEVVRVKDGNERAELAH